ncbi:hypothetical protein [Ferdinandcohnia sp. SAFN-114]|uniref:hypothetical protein n=1 Tax=Ferdinandcohnia sp. SAFN-114 TaxID=3387275 RepID=UPI003F823B40
MKEVIILIAEIVNIFHDLLLDITKSLGLVLTDKDLHFWVIGIIGIIGFSIVQDAFRLLARYSITAISFTYTFTMIVIIVFAIEIQQQITGRGKMDFIDAVVGLWGFLLFFAVYVFIRLIILGIKKWGTTSKAKKDRTTRYNA